jgi:hypothetical protein
MCSEPHIPRQRRSRLTLNVRQKNMKRLIFIFLAIFSISASGCLSHRISGVRVDSPFGNPLSGASVSMSSTHSGHPVYPTYITGSDGIAALDMRINSSFLFSVKYFGNDYYFRSDDFRFEKSSILVLRLKPDTNENH